MPSLASQIFGYGLTVGSAFAEATAVGIAKNIGLSTIRNGSKMIPIIGNIASAIDDAYQQYQINSLKDTAQGLKDSQSLLQGQMSELQFGLNEGKAKQEEFLKNLLEVKEKLKDSSKNAAEIAALKLEKQALKELVVQNQKNISQIQQTQDFLSSQQERLSQTLELVADKTELNQAEIDRLKEISQLEKSKLSDLQDSFSKFESEFNSFKDNIDSINQKHTDLVEKVNSIEKKNEEISSELALLRAELLALKNLKNKDLEKITKLSRYHDLKNEKKQLEKELKRFLDIPDRMPAEKAKGKVLGIGLYPDINLSDWLSFTAHPLDSIVYDYYLARFGLESMSGWERCLDGDPLATNILNSLNKDFFSDSNFTEKEFLAKAELLLKLKENTSLLNEIATELDLQPEVINQENLVGTTADTYFPLFLIASFIFISLYLFIKSFSKKQDKSSHQSVPIYDRSTGLLVEDKNNHRFSDFLITTSLLSSFLFIIAFPIYKIHFNEINQINKISSEEFKESTVIPPVDNPLVEIPDDSLQLLSFLIKNNSSPDNSFPELQDLVRYSERKRTNPFIITNDELDSYFTRELNNFPDQAIYLELFNLLPEPSQKIFSDLGLKSYFSNDSLFKLSLKINYDLFDESKHSLLFVFKGLSLTFSDNDIINLVNILNTEEIKDLNALILFLKKEIIISEEKISDLRFLFTKSKDPNISAQLAIAKKDHLKLTLALTNCFYSIDNIFLNSKLFNLSQLRKLKKYGIIGEEEIT